MRREKKPNSKNKKNNENLKLIILTVLLIICIGLSFAVYYFAIKDSRDEKELAYSELISEVNEDNIEEIEMTAGSSTLTIVLKGEGEEKDRTKTSLVPNTQAFMEWIQEKIDKGETTVKLTPKNVNPILRISDTLFSLLPTILLVALMLMIFKMQGLGGDSGKVYGGEDGSKKTDIRFDDIAGLDEEKYELVEIVDFLKTPEAYAKMGAKIPKGILLYGKPGTGKTLIAKAIAGEAGVPFISMSGSEFIEMFAGL